jgi:two-component system response regulator AtoC
MRCRNSSVLLADDDENVLEVLTEVAGEICSTVYLARSANEVWDQFSQKHPDVVVLDIRFPDSGDLTLLERIKKEAPHTEVIVLSAVRSVPLVVQAIKIGAFDFVQKPFIREEMQNRISKALDMQELRRSQDVLIKQLEEESGLGSLIGQSSAMRDARRMLSKLSVSDSTVLVQGESGTGKELAARALHLLSRRRSSPFVVVNSAAIPDQLTESVLFGHRRGAFTGATETAKGSFEVVGDGTLFLDEIGDMPVQQQTCLLRVLEDRRFKPVGDSVERECRARFVTATNHDLKQSVESQKFREDLFYRVSVATIYMAPLRERLEDIPMLTAYFSQAHTSRMGRPAISVEPAVLKLFQNYAWPGNVRELRNVMESAIILMDAKQDMITMADIPQHISPDGNAQQRTRKMSKLHQAERDEIVRALQLCNGNQMRCARLLGVHRNTLRNKIRSYGISLRAGFR